MEQNLIKLVLSRRISMFMITRALRERKLLHCTLIILLKLELSQQRRTAILQNKLCNVFWRWPVETRCYSVGKCVKKKLWLSSSWHFENTMFNDFRKLTRLHARNLQRNLRLFWKKLYSFSWECYYIFKKIPTIRAFRFCRKFWKFSELSSFEQ